MGSFTLLLLQFLPGAAGAALFLPTDFVALLIVRGFCSTEPSLHMVGQKAPGQKAVKPLRAAALDLDGDPRRPVQEAHTRRGLIDMLPAWPRGTDEGLLQVLLVDLQSPQARLKRALFFLTDAKLTHRCTYRLHGDHVTSKGTAPAERLKGQLNVL
jgi:hypothetical protein